MFKMFNLACGEITKQVLTPMEMFYNGHRLFTANYGFRSGSVYMAIDVCNDKMNFLVVSGKTVGEIAYDNIQSFNENYTPWFGVIGLTIREE